MNHKRLTSYLFTTLFLLMLVSLNNGIFAEEKQNNEPKIVQPGEKSKAPSDAIVLFDNGSLENFVSVDNGGPAEWKVEGDFFSVIPGKGNIETKQSFGDCQLHIEWRSPIKDVELNRVGQDCGNSGIYLMGKFEVQVLNSYNSSTYTTGQAGAIYGNYPPLVNASLKPGEWQTYDIFFTAPKYAKGGKLESPAYITVVHNGVLIQNHVKVEEPTPAANEKTPNDAAKLPLMLQEHNNEVSYRNIWIREL